MKIRTLFFLAAIGAALAIGISQPAASSPTELAMCCDPVPICPGTPGCPDEPPPNQGGGGN